MSMKDFHCEMFDLVFRFSLEEIDQDALLKALGIKDKDEYTDEDGDMVIPRSFGSREKTSNYHAHLRVILFKDGRGRIDIHYHDTAVEMEDEKPPSSEDVAQWLGGFFKSDTMKALITAAYTFDKSFAPTIALPFPFATSEKMLAGSTVTGLSIQLAKEAPLDVVTVQRSGDETFIFIYSTSEIRLKDFDLIEELERLYGPVSSLIRKQESGEEKDNARKDE